MTWQNAFVFLLLLPTFVTMVASLAAKQPGTKRTFSLHLTPFSPKHSEENSDMALFVQAADRY